MDKKKVSGHIPFNFLNELGHDTCAMERFFSLPRQARETLTDAVSVSDNPGERAGLAVKSLAEDGEGYIEPF
jgi:hypothetical protein